MLIVLQLLRMENPQPDYGNAVHIPLRYSRHHFCSSMALDKSHDFRRRVHLLRPLSTREQFYRLPTTHIYSKANLLEYSDARLVLVISARYRMTVHQADTVIT